VLYPFKKLNKRVKGGRLSVSEGHRTIILYIISNNNISLVLKQSVPNKILTLSEIRITRAIFSFIRSPGITFYDYFITYTDHLSSVINNSLLIYFNSGSSISLIDRKIFHEYFPAIII
jgi:hypothetical protein